MRLEVYEDTTLAAAFEYGREPTYYGPPGRRVRQLVERPHYSYNPWTDRLAPAPLDDSPEWWVADIVGALVTGEGLRIVGIGLPPLGRRAVWDASPDPAEPAPIAAPSTYSSFR